MKKKSKKKKEKSKSCSDTRYNNQKYASFNVNYQVHNRKELLDMDYIDKLSDSEKAWLNVFLQETVVTNFKHKGKRLIKDNSTIRELYKENNKRNVDLMNLGRAHNILYSIDHVDKAGVDPRRSKEDMHEIMMSNCNKITDTEDYLIALLTIKRHLENVSDEGD